MAGQRGARSWIRGNLIGAGSFGKVNLAVNREDGEVFAVKSVSVEQFGGDVGAQVSLSALENEIEILQSLESKFVVRCLGSDWTEEGGRVMRNAYLEYMPEGCLTDFLKQFSGAEEPLDEHLIRTYTRSIVQGIDYLHAQGIVHCDIKGKNILVGNGSVKLTDLGSAKRVGLSSKESEQSSGAKVNGTPLWMAPEVVRQDEQGLASDIWSLGCTVVEMATGKAPWSDMANPMVALFQIGCSNEIPAVPASLSAEAHDFLGHCFQRDPRMRWTSAQLLEHPFLTTRHSPKAIGKGVEVASRASPKSVMQFPAGSVCSSGFSSVFRNSVPILAMPSFFKRGLVCEARVEVKGSCGFPSSPFEVPAECEWIVVRSPLGSPRSSCPGSVECSLVATTSEEMEGVKVVAREDADVVEEEQSSSNGTETETEIEIEVNIDSLAETCVNDEGVISTGSSDVFPREQCSSSIAAEMLNVDCPFEGSAKLVEAMSLCIEDNDDDEEETRIEESHWRCGFGDGNGVGVEGDAYSGRNFESGVEIVAASDASTSAEDGCDVARHSLWTTPEMEHGGLGWKVESVQGSIRRVEGDLFGNFGMEISGFGVVTVQNALFLWPDDHACMKGMGNGWEGSNVDMKDVNRENDVPRNKCKEPLRYINSLLKKMLTTICVSCALLGWLERGSGMMCVVNGFVGRSGAWIDLGYFSCWMCDVLLVCRCGTLLHLVIHILYAGHRDVVADLVNKNDKGLLVGWLADFSTRVEDDFRNSVVTVSW